MAGIKIEIEVDDKGTVKVKQFSDETKKAFAEMKKGPAEARGSLDSLRDSWVGVTAKIGIFTAAGYAAKRMFFDTSIEIASAGGEIKSMARTLNMTTDDLQEWSYVTKMAGTNIQEFGGAFKFLTRSMNEALQGSGDAGRAFNSLGINLKDTTGKTKDQQTVLMETIGALEKYRDGVNRDALMLAIFGGAFMSIKPLIDQGTKAIEENREEAERLSLIIGKDVIKSLSESEDSFKRFGMTMKVAKMEFLEPFIKDIRNLVEELLGLKKAWEEGGIKGVWEEIKEQSEKYKIEALTPSARVKEWVAGWNPPKINKPEASAPSGKKEVDIIKDVLAAIEAVTAAEELRGQVFLARAELVESGWSKEKDIVEQVREELANLERETNELGEVTVGKQELMEAGWERVKKEAEQAGKVGETFAKNFGNSWDFNVKRIISESENMGDALKTIFDGIVDAFASAISKMISNWVIFGSVTGEYKSGSGVAGWLGSALTTITSMQHGGWINEPIYGIGKSGQRYMFGESESEMVTPKSQTGRGGTESIIIQNFIQVNDPNTFEKLYGPVVKKISAQSAAEAKRLHQKRS